MQHYKGHSKCTEGHSETQRAEEVPAHPCSEPLPTRCVAQPKGMRLAKQTAATILEITHELAREKKLRQTRNSVTSQNKYGLLLKSCTEENLEWHPRPLSSSPRTGLMALGKRGYDPTTRAADLGCGIWRALEWDGIFTGDIYWYDFPSDLIILARLPAPYNPSIVFTSNSSSR